VQVRRCLTRGPCRPPYRKFDRGRG
jgi:hypothetical protein